MVCVRGAFFIGFFKEHTTFLLAIDSNQVEAYVRTYIVCTDCVCAVVDAENEKKERRYFEEEPQ